MTHKPQRRSIKLIDGTSDIKDSDARSIRGDVENERGHISWSLASSQGDKDREDIWMLISEDGGDVYQFQGSHQE